jgi:hypothetical protein
MSHQSEDRLPESASGSPSPVSARILPFERPRSELQRAIQERAQEAIDLDRDREREVKRPQPLKWLIIFVIALIPVIAIFGAVDSFLRAFYRINQAYSAPQNAQPQPGDAADNPADESAGESQTPGVVMLQPYSDKDAGKDQVARPAPAPTPEKLTPDEK